MSFKRTTKRDYRMNGTSNDEFESLKAYITEISPSMTAILSSAPAPCSDSPRCSPPLPTTPRTTESPISPHFPKKKKTSSSLIRPRPNPSSSSTHTTSSPSVSPPNSPTSSNTTASLLSPRVTPKGSRKRKTKRTSFDCSVTVPRSLQGVDLTEISRPLSPIVKKRGEGEREHSPVALDLLLDNPSPRCIVSKCSSPSPSTSTSTLSATSSSPTSASSSSSSSASSLSSASSSSSSSSSTPSTPPNFISPLQFNSIRKKRTQGASRSAADGMLFLPPLAKPSFTSLDLNDAWSIELGSEVFCFLFFYFILFYFILFFFILFIFYFISILFVVFCLHWPNLLFTSLNLNDVWSIQLGSEIFCFLFFVF